MDDIEIKTKGLFKLTDDKLIEDDPKWETSKLTVKGFVLSTGQVFKLVNGEFVEDKGDEEDAEING